MPYGFSINHHGAVAELVINQPQKRNAISYEMWEALPQILAEIDQDEAVTVLVVRGADATFSAGADISEFETQRSDPKQARIYNDQVEHAEHALIELRKPTIAMIQGYCIGGGCELALACDLRFADDTARLGITPAKLGLVYNFTSTRQLVNLVGPSYAKYLLFSATTINAEDALRAGMIDQVFERHKLTEHTFQFATTVCSRSQVSVQGAKTIVDKIADGATTADDESRSLPVRAVQDPDYQEGVRAFLEKREPRFFGR